MSALDFVAARLLRFLLLDNTPNPDRARTVAVLAVGLGVLLLESVLVAANGWTSARTWPDGPFAGLTLATVAAIAPTAFGFVAVLRSATDRWLALACLMTGAATLGITFRLISR